MTPVIRRHLRPLKLGKRSKKFFVFDTETGIVDKDTGKITYTLSARPEHVLFGVIYGDNGYKKVLFSADELRKEFLKKKYKGSIIYAHNAEYDLSATFGNIYELDPDAIFNGKFIYCTNGNVKFADSYNLLPASVEKIGEMLKFPKLTLGVNYESHVTTMDRDIQYCIRDCEIVYKALTQLFTGLEPSFTIGSLSLKLFRKDYLKRTIKVNELSDRFFDALYGGRTEAFYIGKVRANVYDINSAYPYAMRELRFPDPSKLRYASFRQYANFLHDTRYEGMITATVIVPQCYIPPLPFRTADKLLFPVGTFTGSWTLFEFRHALKVYPDIRILNIHELIYAPAIESPFRDFVNDKYNQRENSTNESERYFLKLFLNNLFGKTIQRSTENYHFCKSEKEAVQFMRERKLKLVELITVSGGFFVRWKSDKLFAHTIACFGAYITSYVRCMLLDAMLIEPHEVVYCDTDSIFTTASYDWNDTKLGGWKRENKTVKRIRALKDYVFVDVDGTEKQMLKGVPKKKAVQLDAEANVFVFKRMIKTRESLRRSDNLPPGTFIEQTKFLTGDYKKREVLSNGKTKPFKLNHLH